MKEWEDIGFWLQLNFGQITVKSVRAKKGAPIELPGLI
jgi:hypothetical protein